MLATCAYIDLNPVAAGVATTPETSKHTSVRQRVQHARDEGQLAQLKDAARNGVAGSGATRNVEQTHWLCPLEDRRRRGAVREENAREGMVEGLSLGSYLLLVDYTGRLCRNGKARIGREVASILDRLGTNADVWEHRIKWFFSKSRLLGSYFATDRQRLRDLAARRGLHHLDNLAGYTAK